jgi:hypothetical protein
MDLWNDLRRGYEVFKELENGLKKPKLNQL